VKCVVESLEDPSATERRETATTVASERTPHTAYQSGVYLYQIVDLVSPAARAAVHRLTNQHDALEGGRHSEAELGFQPYLTDFPLSS
jgi:hypothetical protein